MKSEPPNVNPFLGLVTNGDLGPWTMYTSQRGKLVIFPKSWPKDPATYHQALNRLKWRHAALRWQSIGPDVRARWMAMGMKANLTITGFNLFLYYILGKNKKVVETLQRNTRINVLNDTGPPLPPHDVA